MARYPSYTNWESCSMDLILSSLQHRECISCCRLMCIYCTMVWFIVCHLLCKLFIFLCKSSTFKFFFFGLTVLFRDAGMMAFSDCSYWVYLSSGNKYRYHQGDSSFMVLVDCWSLGIHLSRLHASLLVTVVKVDTILMPMTHAPETGTRKLLSVSGTRNQHGWKKIIKLSIWLFVQLMLNRLNKLK